MIQPWILASRPKTLTAAVVPVVVATLLAYAGENSILMWVVCCCLLASLLIQIATNFINDVVDFKKGVDNERRLGPTRAAQAGLLRPDQLWWGAGICLGGALLLGLPLVAHGGLPILGIGLVSLFLAYAYTGGPFPLSTWGLGEIFVVLFFGVIPVLGVFYLLSGVWDRSAVLLGLQVGLHCAILIAINNLRDLVGDQLAGRKTVQVLFGPGFGKFIIYVLIWTPFLIGVYWFPALNHWGGLLPYLTLPLAVALTRNIIATEPSSTYNRFLGQAALLHLSFGLLTGLGIYLCRQ